MNLLMGIDVGTTSTRAIVIDETGDLHASAVEEYPLSTPHPLWSEQDPEDWWRATENVIRHVLMRVKAEDIKGVGLSGQMHGLVMLDEKDQVLRPAILWNDQRTFKQCEWITSQVGRETIVGQTCNPVLTGFTAGKVIWVRENEPELYERARKFLLPKDFIRYRLTGEFATEVSDASGTSLFNVPERKWSADILSKLEIPLDRLPSAYESFEVSGKISWGGAKTTGLKQGTPVVGGGGDQAAGAVGTGIVRPGAISISLGTSGVVFAFCETPKVDEQLRTHTFCHAVPNTWHVMGVMLSAGGSLRWFRDSLCSEESAISRRLRREPYELITEQAEAAPAGCEGLLFLPYLTGERTPHPDPFARGAFVGLTLRHSKSHLARAVFEGVAFGLRDSVEILKEMNMQIREVRAIGGGARSRLWLQIQSDVYGMPLSILGRDEGPAYGVALLAGVGAGLFGSVQQACDATTRITSTVEPDPKSLATYEELYQMYKGLYPALKGHFGSVAQHAASVAPAPAAAPARG